MLLITLFEFNKKCYSSLHFVKQLRHYINLKTQKCSYSFENSIRLCRKLEDISAEDEDKRRNYVIF